MDLPLTRHTRVLAAKVGLELARPVEGIAEVLAEALQLKNDPLAPFPGLAWEKSHPVVGDPFNPVGLVVFWCQKNRSTGWLFWLFSKKAADHFFYQARPILIEKDKKALYFCT